MCYIQIIHFTRCDTRRPATINTFTGEAVYHPLEPPGPCEHHDPHRRAACPYHGLCCAPGLIPVCYVKKPKDVCRGWQAYHRVIHPSHMDTSELPSQMIEIEDWDELELNTDIYAYEENIRGHFFDIGAHVYDLADKGERIVEYVLNGRTESPQEEEALVEKHGELYAEWMVAHEELNSLTEAWEILASSDSMEVCPASLLRVHPWRHIFQVCPTRRPGFRQFTGIPFRWLDNIDHQDEILHWHPYYTQRGSRSPREPPVDLLWRSPAPPPRRSPELQARVVAQNQPYPGHWVGTLNEATQQDQAVPSFQRESAPSPSSGRGYPSYEVPPHEEHDMEEKDTHGDQPSTTIGSTKVSPTTVPHVSTDPSPEQIPPKVNAVDNLSPGEIPPSSAASAFSGLGPPSWVIPYGEEPDMDWKEIHWGRPTTSIDSPETSPTAIPHVFADLKPGEDHNSIPGNPFDDENEDEWDENEDEWHGYDSMGPEELAVYDFLRITAQFKLEPAPKIPSWRVKKRRCSDIVQETGYEDFERPAKRQRII